MADTKCDCGASHKLSEVLEINKSWHEEYAALREKYKSLEDRYYKEITSRLQVNEHKEDEVNVCLKNTESESEEIEQKKTEENIEVLKQQLIVYKEDFLQEQHENKHLQKENQMLKSKLHEQNNTIEILTKKKESYKRSFELVNREKQHICDELKRLSVSAPSSFHL